MDVRVVTDLMKQARGGWQPLTALWTFRQIPCRSARPAAIRRTVHRGACDRAPDILTPPQINDPDGGGEAYFTSRL